MRRFVNVLCGVTGMVFGSGFDAPKSVSDGHAEDGHSAAMSHFIEHGIPAGYNPSPFFDTPNYFAKTDNSGMTPILPVISDLFQQAIARVMVRIELETGQSPKAVVIVGRHSDYQCDNSFDIFKKYGTELGLASAFAVATEIQNAALGILEENPSMGGMFDSIKAVQPGYVNVQLSSGFIINSLSTLNIQGAVYRDPSPKRVVVDFSSPNIAKEMHVGHLRSTILGETTARILEDVGHTVLRINHVGDWGTQFGMLIEYIKDEFPDFLEYSPAIRDLDTFYKAAKAKFTENEEFQTRSRERVVKLQRKDEESIAAWKVLCQISRDYFKTIYARLGITLEERGESYYNDMIPGVVDLLTEKGLITESDGAKVVFTDVLMGGRREGSENELKSGEETEGLVPAVEDPDLEAEEPAGRRPLLMVVKRDGGYGYDSTDLAAIRYRLESEKADWIIYFTDEGQSMHFSQVFEVAKAAGWLVDGKSRVDHCAFGVIQGQDGKRYKTRSGETPKLMDMLDEAVARSKRDLTTRIEKYRKQSSPDAPVTYDEEWIGRTAEIIGIAAVRYFDMRGPRLSNYVYDLDRMLDAKGNSAVYLLYAYARTCAVLRQATSEFGIDIDSLNPATDIETYDDTERKLALELVRFPDMIVTLLDGLFQHTLAVYMEEVAKALTAFYNKNRVFAPSKAVDGRKILSLLPETRSRLTLLKLTKSVLAKGFYYLGITPLENM